MKGKESQLSWKGTIKTKETKTTDEREKETESGDLKKY